MAVIRFDPNTPVEVALKYDTGREVESKKTFVNKETGEQERLPNQIMYTVCGDDTIYLPVHVGERISQMGIKKAELISICKRQQGTMVKWEVKRLAEGTEPQCAPNSFDSIPTAIDATPLERKLTTSVKQAQQRKAVTPQCAPSAAATVPAKILTPAAQSNSIPAPISHTLISKLMASSLIAAFDATQECERYAHCKGVEVEFGADDIRAISNTIFIALSKDPRFVEPQKVNGAA
jgi:hypothetical protein